MPDIGLVLGLLAVVAFLAAIGRRVGLPGPIVFAIGGLALALAFAVILVTLIGQGLTLPAVISRLGGGVVARGKVTSRTDQADDARLHTATHDLLDRLMDVERAELQRMQNSAVVDNLVVRRLQRGLDLLRLRDRI